MLERIVPILLMVVYTIFVLYASALISPNYVLIKLDPTTHTLENYAVMFTEGGCQSTIDDLSAFGIDKSLYTCVRITNVKP